MNKQTTATFPYTTVPNDPMAMRSYTLRNGLRVFMSVNNAEPRIYTQICFRVGSKYDPAHLTGLAHYMEHMLFKGSSRIGTLDWERESALLEQIADLFEQYRTLADPEERSAVYRRIDELSTQAAQYVAANEYDRLTTVIGASETNAYTAMDKTVYINDIPANEIERWLLLESERFRHLSLRLFHTELETVYEEFNMSQADDGRKTQQALRQMLFPAHPYGTQTTLGKPEHLKNPSMRAIQQFYETYYVPNNAAICLAGDFDPDQTIALIDKYFGQWEAREFEPFKNTPQPEPSGPQHQNVEGQESPYIQMGWRLDGVNSPDYFYSAMLHHLLHNQQAGLLDINLNQEQLVLDSEAYTWHYEDYSVFGLWGQPREGQTLEEVETLLLAELDKVRLGDWPDWMLEAVIKDLKLGDLKSLERNEDRVGAMATCFLMGLPWEEYTSRYERVEQFTKADIMDFVARRLPIHARAVVYKRQGEETNMVKVEKPEITPVNPQREALSAFARDFMVHTPPRLQPQFMDLERDILHEQWQPGLRFDYVHNPVNPVFRLDYIFEIGKSHAQELPIAFSYIAYLGTSRYDAAEIQQLFFQLGLSFSVNFYDERCYISLSGLEESLEEGIALMEHFLSDMQPDQDAWDAVIEDILTGRENAKQDREIIFRYGLGNYAKYGAVSPFTTRLSEQALKDLAPEAALYWIKNLCEYEHRVYYYGQLSQPEAGRIIRRHHKTADILLSPPVKKDYPELPTTAFEVLFTHFPMVQNEVTLLSRGTPHFNLPEHLMADLYNEYFGHGLSSIVFQEIREAKALAYHTYAYYSTPNTHDTANYLKAYAGTQPDKLEDALSTMLHLMDNMPIMEQNINQAINSIQQRIETDRIVPRKRYWEAQSLWDVGLQHDILADVYAAMQNATPKTLQDFHQEYVKGRPYKILVIGDRAQTPFHYLEQLGPVKEYGLEELFGY